MEKKGYRVSASPHLHAKESTASLMRTFFIVLLFPALWGVFVFGFSALLVLFSTLLTALLAEGVLSGIFKKRTLQDGSAAITGLLVGMNMPPEIPLPIPIFATLFAILVVKWSFGGLGKNWANPAIAGRVFVFLSWSKEMMVWKMPQWPWKRNFFTFITATKKGETLPVVADLCTGATPLGLLKEGANSFADLKAQGAEIHSSVDMIHAMVGERGYQISSLDVTVTDAINSFFHCQIKPGWFDPFIGLVPGSIGEVSALFLLLGGIFLLSKKIITWEIPVAFIGTFALFVWIFGDLPYEKPLFSCNPWYHLMSGGLLLGAIYMATDLVTSPITPLGQLLFGAGCGLLTFLVRFLGNYPEGVSLAILFMNILVPLLDRYINPKRFGSVKKRASFLLLFQKRRNMF